MKRNQVIQILLITTLVLGTLSFIPKVNALASSYTENFESRTIGQLPSSTENWYTYRTDNAFTGSNSIVSGSGFGGGSTRAFQYQPSTTSSSSATYFINHIPTINPCGLGGDGAVFETDFILNNPAGSTTKHFQIGLASKDVFLSDGLTLHFGVQFDYGATTATAIRKLQTDTTASNNALSGVSLTYGTAYHLSLAMSCSTSTTFTIVISGYSPFVETVAGTTFLILDNIALSAITSTPTTENLQIDNMAWTVKTRLVSTTYNYGSLLENFTRFNVGDVPTSTTYTLTYTPNGGTFAGVQDCINLGSNCVSTAVGGTLDFQYLGTKSLCSSTDDFSFELGATLNPASTQTSIQIGIQDTAYPTTPTNAVYWTLARQSSTNTKVDFVIIKNGVTTTVTPYGSADNFIRFHDFAHITCPSNLIQIKSEGGGSASVAGTFTNSLKHLVVRASVASSTQNAYVDNINFPVSTLLAAPPTPTNTYTVTDAINGFDASRSGEFIVTRENLVSSGEDTIRFLSGVNFAQSYSETTNCNRLQGVVALQDDGAAFIKCDTGTSSNVLTMRLIDKFGDPITGGECLREDAPSFPQLCDGTINIDSSTIDEDNILHLNSFYPTIVNVKQNNPSTGFDDEINYFVLSASHTNGKISELFLGYSYYKVTSGGDPQNAEIAHENEVSFSGAGDVILQPHDLCTSQIVRNYAIANGNSIGQFDTTVTEFPNENPPAIRGGYSRSTAGNSLSDGAQAIDCNSGLVAWLTDSTVGVFNRDTDNNLWTRNLPTGGAGAQAVVISDYVIQSGITRGPFMAYSFNDETTIVNASSGAILSVIPNPVTGANGIREIGMDNVAQKMYINDKFHVYRYDIHALTTVTPAGVGDGGTCILSCDPINGTHTQTSSSSSGGSSSGGGGSSSGGGGGSTLPPINFGNAPSHPFGINITYVADGLGISVISVQVLVGLILVVVFTIWMYRGTGSFILATLGAGLGLIVATLMALIPAWAVMAIVLFLIVILGKMFFGGFTGGEEN